MINSFASIKEDIKNSKFIEGKIVYSYIRSLENVLANTCETTIIDFGYANINEDNLYRQEIDKFYIIKISEGQYYRFWSYISVIDGSEIFPMQFAEPVEQYSYQINGWKEKGG